MTLLQFVKRLANKLSLTVSQNIVPLRFKVTFFCVGLNYDVDIILLDWIVTGYSVSFRLIHDFTTLPLSVFLCDCCEILLVYACVPSSCGKRTKKFCCRKNEGQAIRVREPIL